MHWDKSYRDERLAAERPGWAWQGVTPGTPIDVRNPSVAAFDLLDRARLSAPSAKLVTWNVECACPHHHASDEEYDHEEHALTPAATDTFLGRAIVFLA